MLKSVVQLRSLLPNSSLAADGAILVLITDWSRRVVVISCWGTVFVEVLRENKQEAWKSGLKCVDRKLSCLAVRQPTPTLIGVAMAEGVCVEWVSNSSVLAEVAHPAAPASLCSSSSSSSSWQTLRIWLCIIAGYCCTAFSFAMLFH